MKERRTSLLGVKTTPTQRKLIRELSTAQGFRTESEFIRQLVNLYVIGLATAKGPSLGRTYE